MTEAPPVADNRLERRKMRTRAALIRTTCCTKHGPGGHQLNELIRSTPGSRQRRLPQDSVIRNEFKYDLFGSDLSDIISVIEGCDIP